MSFCDFKGLPSFAPIGRLHELQDKALSYLGGRSNAEIDEIIAGIDKMLQEYFLAAKRDWIVDALQNNREILNYLDDGKRTFSGLSDFLRSEIPDDAQTFIDFPEPTFTRSLVAFEDALQKLNRNDFFDSVSEPELFAALALKELAEGVRWYQAAADVEDLDLDSSVDIKSFSLVSSAIDATEIVSRIDTVVWHNRFGEAMGFLRQSQRQLAEANIDLQKEVFRLQEQQENFKSELARKAANARHVEHRSARLEAVADWEKNGHSYSSVAAYARHNCKRFGVLERTLAMWISKRTQR